MGASEEMIGEMAIALWDSVATQPYTHIPAAANQAARDLAKLYSSANGGQTLAVFRKNLGIGAGRKLVVAALTGTTLPRYGGYRVPRFKISKQGKDLVWDGDEGAPVRSYANGDDDDGQRSNPSRAPFTLTEVREKLASRPADEKCFPSCQGWEVFMTDDADHEPFEIEICDECASYFKDGLRDDDVAQLPEAQLALAKAFEAEDAEEREEVEANVREIHGGKVVPRGNPHDGVSRTREQWYRVSWTERGKPNSGYYPESYLPVLRGHLKSLGLREGRYTIVAEAPVKNPAEQWYRVSWTLPNGRKDSAVYPQSYLDSFIGHLRSAHGLTDHDYSVKPEGVRHGLPPGVPNPGTLVQIGYDLTDFEPNGFQHVLQGLGLSIVAGHKLPPMDGVPGGWMWSGDRIRIVTANDPITGRYYNTGRRGDEKNYAGYMGIEGSPERVTLAKRLIKKHAKYIKGGPSSGLGYIDFSEPRAAEEDDDDGGRRRYRRNGVEDDLGINPRSNPGSDYTKGANNAIAIIDQHGVHTAEGWLKTRMASRTRPALPEKYVRGYRDVLGREGKR